MTNSASRLLASLVAALVAFAGAVACQPSAGAAEGDGAEPRVAPDDPARAHGTGRTNRLASSSSPYLLLHKSNPVDWYPWGEEALARAKAEDKPIFLSVGYSTCFWCHVMEREVFSDPAIAATMNEHFVNVKVDREERPDLDEIYMTATQLLTRSGGWPNSVFLTPDLQPFFAGTYFPPEDKHGRPGFPRVLEALRGAWSDRREQVVEQAANLTAAIERALVDRQQPAEQPPGRELVKAAVDGLGDAFDADWGGFGNAPKFPSPANLLLLLEVADARVDAETWLATTLDRMARGGIYDQLGGGFHRYATDREWQVPHFEKMLYDNGLLLEVYARWHARSGSAQAARVVRETAAFLAREMTDPAGGLWSAIDAETDGHEGAFYVWRREEVAAELGAEGLAFAAPLLGLDRDPFFEGDAWVLHLPKPLEDAAAASGLGLDALRARLDPLRSRLLAARDARERPLTDDKVLTDWNGMAIAGLATGGRVLGEPSMIDQARRAAAFVLEHMRTDDGLRHAWRRGEARIAAYLDDYAFLIRGLLALDRASDEDRWLDAAVVLADELEERLGAEAGGWYAAVDQPDLLVRTRPIADGAIPAGNAVAALGLLDLAERTGEARFRQRAERALRSFAGFARRAPTATRTLAIASHRLAGPVTAVAVTAGNDEPEGDPLTAEARSVVRAAVEAEGAGTDGGRAIAVNLEITDGWHVNANPASDDFLVPTTIDAATGTLEGVAYPAPEMASFAFTEEPIAVWQGKVRIAGRYTPAPEAAGRLVLTYQACDHERCLIPVRLELTVP